MFLCFLSCDSSTETEDTKLTANAGEDQTTIVGSYAVFDPTKSTGNFSWYDWQQDESNPDTVNIFSGDKESKAEKDIHKVAFVKEGIYRFILIVRSGVTPGNLNGTNSSEPDTLVITVNPNSYSKFEDPNLEAIIRARLSKQVEELDENTLLELDSLSYADVPPPQSISSIKGLEYCKNLIYLHLGSQNISDISPLSSLTKLKNLWLDQNEKIADITLLENLTELVELNLSCNLITDISSLKRMVSLEYLNLRYNPIDDIAALGNMNELKKLWMSQASIDDLSPLSQLNNLEILWLNDCDINDISQLNNLTNVKTLKLASNNIEDISALSNMEKLEWVALELNNISDISPLKELPNLEYVRLWDNQVTDIKPLIDNAGIGEGDIVGLDDNPLSEKSINEYIPVLQNRGVVVTWS
jgi:Leucine-rich repeat (LRR) protein